MNELTFERLFGWRHAFDEPATAWIVGGIVAVLAAASILVSALAAARWLSAGTQIELRRRLLSWWIMAPLIVGPVLLGGFWTILAVAVLSLLCYREFARATGLFRERLVSVLVALAILLLTFASLDHWYDFFMALGPLGVISIAGVTVVADEPRGYIQRAALGVFAFLFFGVSLAHLGYFANDAGYRPIVLLLLVAVELNDVFAYLCGRLFGRAKLMPQTSPNKTWAGAIGAVVLTTGLLLVAGPSVFRGTAVNHTQHFVMLGVLISVAGQLGDLMLSAIKRDVGIKDFAATIPGHGGLLDRFDSLVLVAPAVFHYIGYLHGIGLYSQSRIFTGG
jgi:phosphatidate cytidylyltransferase